MNIGIDVDGVLADFNTHFMQRVAEVTGRDLFQPKPFEITTWDYDKAVGYTPGERSTVWASISADRSFWATLPVYPDAPDFLVWLHRQQQTEDVYFITSRVGATAKAQTEDWLELWGFPSPTVLISSDKGGCAKALKLDLYIDDKDENCVAVRNSRGGAVMLARGWNHKQENIPRINYLDIFKQIIIRLQEHH